MLYNRLNKLYRDKAENIYSDPDLSILHKYGVSNTHRTSGGYPNDTMYNKIPTLKGGSKNDENELNLVDRKVRNEIQKLLMNNDIETLRNPDTLTDLLKKNKKEDLKESILEALNNPNLEEYFNDMSDLLTKGPSKKQRTKITKSNKEFTKDKKIASKLSKDKEQFYKTPEGQKELLTNEIKNQIMQQLNKQQRISLMGNIDSWEKKPEESDILFGITDFGKNIAGPILGVLKDIGKKILPDAVQKITDIALDIGNQIIKGAEAESTAFDIYRQLRKDKAINSFITGSKRGYGKKSTTTTTNKRKNRGMLISKLMKEKGLNLGQASKYIKEHNIKY
jgi:hypothetical protein